MDSEWMITVCAPLATAAILYIAKSIHALNIKMAIVVEKVNSHEERFDRQDKRIDRLEERV